jgi:hypothetical protein
MKESAIQNPCQTTMADFSDRTNSTMCLTIAGSAGGCNAFHDGAADDHAVGHFRYLRRILGSRHAEPDRDERG